MFMSKLKAIYNGIRDGRKNYPPAEDGIVKSKSEFEDLEETRTRNSLEQTVSKMYSREQRLEIAKNHLREKLDEIRRIKMDLEKQLESTGESKYPRSLSVKLVKFLKGYLLPAIITLPEAFVIYSTLSFLGFPDLEAIALTIIPWVLSIYIIREAFELLFSKQLTRTIKLIFLFLFAVFMASLFLFILIPRLNYVDLLEKLGRGDTGFTVDRLKNHLAIIAIACLYIFGFVIFGFIYGLRKPEITEDSKIKEMKNALKKLGLKEEKIKRKLNRLKSKQETIFKRTKSKAIKTISGFSDIVNTYRKVNRRSRRDQASFPDGQSVKLPFEFTFRTFNELQKHLQKIQNEISGDEK